MNLWFIIAFITSVEGGKVLVREYLCSCEDLNLFPHLHIDREKFIAYHFQVGEVV
jgi:hypothetical protein